MSDGWLPGVHLVRLRNGPALTPGVRGLKVELDMDVAGHFGRNRPGPHAVGKCEVLGDGRLAISLLNTDAGRTARALLADEILDVYRFGDRPTIRLR